MSGRVTPDAPAFSSSWASSGPTELLRRAAEGMAAFTRSPKDPRAAHADRSEKQSGVGAPASHTAVTMAMAPAPRNGAAAGASVGSQRSSPPPSRLATTSSNGCTRPTKPTEPLRPMPSADRLSPNEGPAPAPLSSDRSSEPSSDQMRHLPPPSYTANQGLGRADGGWTYLLLDAKYPGLRMVCAVASTR